MWGDMGLWRELVAGGDDERDVGGGESAVEEGKVERLLKPSGYGEPVSLWVCGPTATPRRAGEAGRRRRRRGSGHERAEGEGERARRQREDGALDQDGERLCSQSMGCEETPRSQPATGLDDEGGRRSRERAGRQQRLGGANLGRESSAGSLAGGWRGVRLCKPSGREEPTEAMPASTSTVAG